MAIPDRLRDPHIRAATLVGSIDEGVYAVSTADRQALVAAVTEDLAAAADQAVATNVVVGELEVRVDTLETTTETLTGHASESDARVQELETRAEALTQDSAVAADQQFALMVDLAQKQTAVDARLEAVERLAAVMGLIADSPSVPAEIQPPPPSRRPH